MKGNTRQIPLKDLHFDLKNPRYGRRSGEATTEDKALDMIATDFLVDDLLSSISTNGFFEGEPLIVQTRKDSGFKVLEGNRRLSALLILTDDPRAINQKKRGALFRKRLKENGKKIPSSISVVLVDDAESSKQTLAYLGTKHIVGSRSWDSYAKARWMAEVREETQISLTQIKEMIGDTSGLVNRMLEGYYLVEQLREAGQFDEDQSYVRGRGSNTAFPFSWVYSILNMAGARKFLKLEDGEPRKDPLPPQSIENAADLMEMMFGHRQRNKPPVISESRDLGDLAKALLDSAKSAKLRQGTRLDIVLEESKPLAEQLALLVSESLTRLTKANGIVSRGEVDAEQARALDSPTKQTFLTARTLRRSIKAILSAEDEEGIEDEL